MLERNIMTKTELRVQYIHMESKCVKCRVHVNAHPSVLILKLTHAFYKNTKILLKIKFKLKLYIYIYIYIL